jgi:multiple sugar transport system ATP-binding protein
MTVYGNMSFALKLRKISCPVYTESVQTNLLIDENKQLLKEAKALRKKAEKKNEDKEMMEKVSKMYDQILANDEKIKKLLEKNHEQGIWTEKIKELEGRLSTLEKEIKQYQKYLDKGGYSEDVTKTLQDGIEQRKAQKEKVAKELEYYQNNEVPMFKSRKLSKYEIDVEIIRAAKILDLERYLSRKPAALSGGQRQRVALGRAIVRNPKVFLMDEPLSNLDAKLRVQTRSEIINIHKRVNATTIYVTHDQTEAMTMADRIVVMKDGYIQQIDTPINIYNDPANIFVAGFIGNPPMNFLNGKFDGKSFILDGKEENGISFKLNAEQIKLLEDYKDKDIVVGVRPEVVKVKGDEKLNNCHNLLEVNCAFRELMGYDSVIHTFLNGQKFLFKVDSVQNVQSGDDLVVGFNDESLYFFDKETTKRIK